MNADAITGKRDRKVTLCPEASNLLTNQKHTPNQSSPMIAKRSIMPVFIKSTFYSYSLLGEVRYAKPRLSQNYKKTDSHPNHNASVPSNRIDLFFLLIKSPSP